MYRFLSVVPLVALAIDPVGAAELPTTGLRYHIAVRLDPATRRFAGEERLSWTNPSKTTVARVPLHLYLNAFSHLGTTWLRENRSHKWLEIESFLTRNPDPWGWIDPQSIQQLVNGRRQNARWRPIQPDDGNHLDRTLIEVTLPRPVPPSGTLELRVRFSGRLPVPIARTGCTAEFCLVAQWFPKIAVLETEGVRHATEARWAKRQFHASTEFYADFADYKVAIETPRGWTVGATGRRQGAALPAKGGFQRVRYAQRAVHDFAIVLGRDLHDVQTSHRPPGQGAGSIAVRYLLPRGLEHQAEPARRAIERALNLFSRRIGPYPYKTLTVVLPPYSAKRTAGMEYPTLITGLPADPLWDRFPLRHFHVQDSVLMHEFGHQYFYGLLATNEQEEAFLDEGFNSHWDGQCMRALHGTHASAGWVAGRRVDALGFYRAGLARARPRIREPLRRRPSFLYYPSTASHHNYSRGAVTLWTAVGLFGQRRVDRIFAAYFRRFRFRHPDADDFLQVVRETDGEPMAAFLSEAFSRERIPDFKVVSLDSRAFNAPLGRVTDKKGTFTVTRQNRATQRRRLETPRMRDQEQVWVQITDPGWSRAGRSVAGSTYWHPFRLGQRDGESKGKLYESTALITGPAWDHLPATVLLRFDDGVEIRERWDGKAAWRSYRVVRPARLAAVVIDEGHLLELDVVPQNNSRGIEADRRFVADWGSWLGALVQWLSGGLSLWL